MALQNTLRRAGPFTGTGLVSTYPFAFKVFAETDVAVTVSSDPNGLVEETLKLNADYTVSLNEDQDGMPGGSITLATPLAADTRLTINSVVPADQQMELTNHDGFFPTVLNTAFDKVTALIQQLEEKNTRTVTVPSTSTDTPEQLAKDLFDARDRAEAADKNAAASASASASSAATSKSYADKVTGFKDEIITVSDNMADVKTNAANVAAIKGIGDNLPEVLKSSQYAAEAKHWAEQANAIAGSEALMMPGATQALNIGQWMLRKAQVFHSVAEMKASMALADGMSCVTEGYYEPGDGGMGFYRIRPMTASDTDDGGSIHALQNGLCAELIDEGFVRPEQFGAKGDGVADDTEPLMRCLALDRENYCSKIYKTTSPIVTRSGQRINFPGELRYVGDETAILVSNGTDIRLNMNIVRSMGDGLKIEPGTTDRYNVVSECKFCIDKIYAYRHGVNVVCEDETATKACQLNVFKLPYVRSNFYDWGIENAEHSGDCFRVVLSSPGGWVAGNVADCTLIGGRYGLFIQKNSGNSISENIFNCFTESSNGIANLYLKSTSANEIKINFQEGPGKIAIENYASDIIKVYGVTTESFVDSLDVSNLEASNRTTINGKIYSNGGDIIADSMVITGYGCYLTDPTTNRCIDPNYGEYSPGKTLRGLRVYAYGHTGEYVLPSFIGGTGYREGRVEVVVSVANNLTLKDVEGNTVLSVGSGYQSGVYVCMWNPGPRKWESTQITTT